MWGAFAAVVLGEAGFQIGGMTHVPFGVSNAAENIGVEHELGYYMDGGGEGSRTPVRNAICEGFYTFSGSSGVSEALGRPAALRFLESCLVLMGNPGTRSSIQPVRCRLLP
jgi:hypothetical protein